VLAPLLQQLRSWVLQQRVAQVVAEQQREVHSDSRSQQLAAVLVMQVQRQRRLVLGVLAEQVEKGR